MRATIKEVAERLPEGLARHFSKVPFTMRLGATYSKFRRIIARAEEKNNETALDQCVSNLSDVLAETIKESKFYQDFYGHLGWRARGIFSLDEWKEVPVVTKADLQLVPVESRRIRGKSGFCVNTGGTTGQPLEFYLDHKSFAREWAHMHFIWGAHGYKPSHLKLTFRGKHFESSRALRYNAVHNEYVVNANMPMPRVIEAVLSLPDYSVIRWLHGYPSLVAEFAHHVDKLGPSEKERIRGRLFGALLGSEFPAPIYRGVIEEVLTNNIVSWYGHSEMAVIAREITRGVYQTLPTYGFAEAVPTSVEGKYSLVCTSFYNRVHPFIRYDTGDLIEPISQNGGALTFRIADGRVGDFLVDIEGNRHSLTAIIFGRHHKIFGQLRHLQVRQEERGVITLIVTPNNFDIEEEAIRQGFDLEDLPFHWLIEKVHDPVRTLAGKIKLLVKKEVG